MTAEEEGEPDYRPGDYVEVYTDAEGSWRWRLKAANHKVIAASGESFHDKSNAVRAARRVTGFSQVKAPE
jgi:uncharacterized protein YegP (UPF0339 family)